MVAYQTERMHLPTSFLARLSQRLDEVVPVNIIQK